MKRFNASLVGYVLLVFGSGVLVGALGQRFYQTQSVTAGEGAPGKGRPNRAEEFRRRFMHDMRSRVGIRADQEQQINGVLDATRDRVHAVQQRFEPEMKAIRDEQHDRIRAVLDGKQRAEYNRMLEERERRRKQEGK